MAELPAPQSEEPPFDGEITTHLCVKCEDHLTESKADVVRRCGQTVAATPMVYMMLTWIDCLIRHEPWHQERILWSSLSALAIIIAFAFPKDRKKAYLEKKKDENSR